MDKYRQIEVWARLSESEAIIYHCLQNIASQQYMVDRASILRAPINHLDLARSKSEQVFEFIEVIPEDKLEQFSSLEEAIDAHDKAFGD
ncbi:MAG: hypothetical protein KAR22_09365 [Gammaproteobacteria bacterium]|nr:hypothetical protein [Gammaproteobacteria bacterium]